MEGPAYQLGWLLYIIATLSGGADTHKAAYTASWPLLWTACMPGYPLCAGPWCVCRWQRSASAQSCVCSSHRCLPYVHNWFCTDTAIAGHIACDSLSQSEIVVPITVPRSSLSDAAQAALRGEGPEDLVRAWSGRGEGEEVIIGVLDIDCESQNGFNHEDVDALERLVHTVSQACDWCI